MDNPDRTPVWLYGTPNRTPVRFHNTTDRTYVRSANTGRWVRQNNVYGKHKNNLTRLSKCALRGMKIPLTRLSKIPLRHSQIPITTLAIVTHNRNQNVNRYHTRNHNDIRNVAPHITSRNVVSHTQSQIVNDYAMITQSLSHITYAITYTIAIVIA